MMQAAAGTGSESRATAQAGIGATAAGSGADLALIADIGGTNARFALCDPSARVPELLEPRSLRNAGFASLQHAAEHYLAEVGARPRRAAIALACPVGGDEIRLTNRAWAFNRHELRASLGLDELRLLNDFGAIAHAVPALAADERVVLHGQDHALERGPISVLGPGTGFGVGLLAGSAAQGWTVVETEGGHVSFAPLGDEERALADWAIARHGRASWERLLSGSGLAAIDAVGARGGWLRVQGRPVEDVDGLPHFDGTGCVIVYGFDPGA